MATAFDLEAVEEPVAVEGLTLFDILQADNLAFALPEAELRSIGQKVVDDVERDLASRTDWEEVYDRALDVAMQVKKAKNFPWPRAANVKYPLLTVASIQFQARAYPAIVDGSNLVKGRVLGPDPDGQKRARADRIGSHMTWQLLYRMPGWEEETDRLLLMLPIMGCVFRKTYYDPIENANRSEIVSGKDFIVHYWTKSLESAPRYTQVLRYYPYEVAERIAGGQWRDVPVEQDGENSDRDDEEGLVEFYEQHRLLDLDNDGFPEPYVVTTTKEGDVARIVPCFGPESVRVATPMGVERLDRVPDNMPILNVVKIERRQYFTKYSFIPAPDGSFYDIGFGTLLNSISSTIDTSINQLLDAGTLQNAGGGFIGSGVNIRGGNMRFQVGEWKRVDANGQDLRAQIVPMPAPGPSAVLFSLLEFLVMGAKEITASSDALTGMGASTEQPTTLLARIEQAMKMMSGVLKRVHRSFGQELRILRRLNRDYLDEEEYFQLNDEEEALQIGRMDYADEDLDVVPVSDPSQTSDVMKMARSDAEWESFNGDPLVNQKELRRRRMEAFGVRDISKMLDVPPPPPNPEVLLKTADLQIKEKAEDTKALTQKADAALKYAGAAEKLANIGLLPDAATLAAEAVEEGVDGIPGQPGGVSGMAGPPGHEGVPGPVEEAPGPLDGDVGLGDGIDPGAAGAGGPAGPALPGEVPGGGPI